MSDKDLRLQVILSAVDKLTRPFKAMQASNRALASAVKSAKDQLKQLERQSGQLQGFAKTKQQAAQAADALHAARDQASRLALAMKGTDAPAARQVRQFQQARAAVTQLQAKYSTLQTSLQTQRTALQQSGIATRQLADAQRTLKARTAEANTHLAAQQQRLEQQAAQQKRLTDARSRYHQAVGVRNQLAGTGAAMTVTGGATLMGLRPALDEAAHYDKERAEFLALGVGDKMVADAQKYASGLNIIGSSASDNLKILKEAHSVLRDYHEAKSVTPELLRLQFATRFLSSHGVSEDAAQAMRDQSPAVLKIAELRNMINDPDDFKKSVNLSAQALAASGGMVLPDDYMATLKTGGVAAKQMDDKAFYFAMSHIIQQVGGDRTGTSLSSAYQNLMMGRTTQGAAEELNALGLLKKNAIQYGKTGHIKKLKPDAIVNSVLYRSDPFAYLMQEIVPRIRKKHPGLDEAGMETAIAKLFSSRTGADIFVTMYREHANIEKQIKAGREAYNVDQLVKEGSGTAQGQQIALEAKKRDLYRQIGTQLLPLYVKGLIKVSGWLGSITRFFNDHPRITKYFSVAIAGFGLLLSVGGALTLALASLLGPVALLRYGFSLLGIKGSGALSLLGKAIRATAMAGRVLLVGALRHIGTAIVWLGRLMFANPILAIIGVIAGAAVLIWQNWDTLGPKFKALWESVSQAVREKWQAIQDYFQALPGRFKDFGTRIIDSLMDGINEKWQALKSKLTSLTDYLPDWMKGNTTVQATAALHPLANYVGEHDRGGRIPAGRFGLVGELGPEIISGPVNVTSRRATASLAAAALMMGGMSSALAQAPLHPYSLPASHYRAQQGTVAPAGGVTHISIEAPIQIVAQPHHSPQDIAREVARQLDARERQARARAHSRFEDRE